MIRDSLEKIEYEQEHDDEKVKSALQNLDNNGGVDIHLGDHFEIGKSYSGKYIESPGGKKLMFIGKMKPSLQGSAYIIGREPGTDKELVYYKVTNSGLERRDCGEEAGRTVSRFDVAIIPSNDRVEIFNLGSNPLEVRFEGDIEI
ncbi:MAG: hypothetical protein ABEJ95_04155 [Candidatus Nanohalobium sp.]